MPRRLRFAPPGYWLHLTQRGNNKQPVFSTGADLGNSGQSVVSPLYRARTLGFRMSNVGRMSPRYSTVVGLAMLGM